MLKMISAAGVAALVLTPFGATHAGTSAQIEKRYSQCYMDCLYNGDNIVDYCAGDEYKIQDSRLNQAYVMVMKRQNKVGKTKLRSAQRAWIGRRNSNCKNNGDINMIDFECNVNETIARTIWLETYR